MKLIRAISGAKRDPLARAPSKCWGTWCGGGECAGLSESTCAHLVDMMSRMVVHNRLRDETRPARWDQTEQNSTNGGGNLDNSVDSAWFLALNRQCDIKWSQEERDTARRVDHHSVLKTVLRLAQMKYRYFVPEWIKQNAIFSSINHKTGHILIIYRQAGDIL